MDAAALQARFRTATAVPAPVDADGGAGGDVGAERCHAQRHPQDGFDDGAPSRFVTVCLSVDGAEAAAMGGGAAGLCAAPLLPSAAMATDVAAALSACGALAAVDEDRSVGTGVRTGLVRFPERERLQVSFRNRVVTHADPRALQVRFVFALQWRRRPPR